ncbi:hypothetical protein A1D31_37470 [Bradyrhizobium liaoningense]|nr:hypothetical protein A1D31_37470 [Bradyrhizobium liaoningense]
MALETWRVGDVIKEIELMVFHHRADIAFVGVIDLHENITVRMWRDGQGGGHRSDARLVREGIMK